MSGESREPVLWCMAFPADLGAADVIGAIEKQGNIDPMLVDQGVLTQDRTKPASAEKP